MQRDLIPLQMVVSGINVILYPHHCISSNGRWLTNFDRVRIAITFEKLKCILNCTGMQCFDTLEILLISKILFQSTKTARKVIDILCASGKFRCRVGYCYKVSTIDQCCKNSNSIENNHLKWEKQLLIVNLPLPSRLNSISSFNRAVRRWLSIEPLFLFIRSARSHFQLKSNLTINWKHTDVCFSDDLGIYYMTQ